MPLETANYISQLDQSNPDGLTDYVNQGDDHLRLIKTTLVQSFPNINGAVDFSTTELNDLRDNLTHSGTSFNLQGNTLSNVTSLNSDTAVEPRLYNDGRYVRPMVASDTLLLANNKSYAANTVALTSTNMIGMDNTDKIQVGANTVPMNINVNSLATLTINGTSIIELFYPIGTIYENASNSTNPGTLLGFGTWSAFGTGRVLVAIDAGNTVDASRFGSIGQTGGATTHTLTDSEIPAHTHTHAMRHITGTLYGQTVVSVNAPGLGTLTSSSFGSGVAHNNTQPYIVVYRWVRVA